MVFAPESEKLIEAMKEYQSIWESDGKRIVEAYERLSGLKFTDKTISVIVTEGVSQSGSGSMPMRLRAGFSADEKKPIGAKL
jgi:hypothetical protein